jgi:hypothetical protein
MPTKTKSKTNRSTGVVVNVPKEVLNKINVLAAHYPTNTALCKALNITPNKLRHLRGYERCLYSTLIALELSLSKLKK